MIRDLLVNLAIGVGDDATPDYALALARAFDAHLAGRSARHARRRRAADLGR